MKHRKKFLDGLLESAPDRYLYVFRDAFGQKQPLGVKPLGVWDSPATRLRGHATGHYLTALAQAYASTLHDPESHTLIAEKLNYAIDVLHELAQKSGHPVSIGGPFNSNPVEIPIGPNKTSYDSDLRPKNIRTDYWNWGKGFVSGYPPDQFIMLGKRRILRCRQ